MRPEDQTASSEIDPDSVAKKKEEEGTVPRHDSNARRMLLKTFFTTARFQNENKKKNLDYESIFGITLFTARLATDPHALRGISILITSAPFFYLVFY
jgi:hypothetical protein